MPLKSKFLRLYLVSLQRDETVANMGVWDGLQWHWNLVWRKSLFQWELEQFDALLASLQEVHLSKVNSDKTWWPFNSKSEFTVKSFVKAWCCRGNEKNNKRVVWKGLALPRAKLLVWFIIQGKFKTRHRLQRLNLISVSEDKCPFCNLVEESIQHLFLHCKIS